MYGLEQLCGQNNTYIFMWLHSVLIIHMTSTTLHCIISFGQCPAKSPFWVVFQVFKISAISKELLSNGPVTEETVRGVN